MTPYEEASLKAYVEHLEASRKIEIDRTAVMQESWVRIVQILADGPKPATEEPMEKARKRREWFALNAMTSMLQSTPTEDGGNWPIPANIVANALRYADAMIAELERSPTPKETTNG